MSQANRLCVDEPAVYCSPTMNPDNVSRRLLLKRAAALGLLAAVERLVPAYALTSTAHAGSQIALSGDVIDLTIGEQLFSLDGRTGMAMTINETIPGPVIRLKEGQQAMLRVTDRLEESCGCGLGSEQECCREWNRAQNYG
jgi:hypothetical protein